MARSCQTDRRFYEFPLCRRMGLLVALLGLVIGCKNQVSEPPRAVGTPWFEEITSRVGLNFVHDAGPTGPYFMPQIAGSGGAFFDFDDDDRLDIYLVHNGGPDSKSANRLYHQQPDGTFRDVSAGSGLDVSGFGMGVAIGDVNNDGKPDLFLTEYGRVRLFLNAGGGKFHDVTREARIDQSSWGTSACFFDFDRDGWLDLVVANYLDYEKAYPCGDPGRAADFCGPSNFDGMVTRLYHNLGAARDSPAPAPQFEDRTVAAGLTAAKGPGLGVVCADFSGDHWPDIFVANDGQPNHLWINQHDGTFREEAILRGIAVNSMGRAEANMGIAVGDLNGDGLLDVFVTHLVSETPTLWQQGPAGLFQDRTGVAGLASPVWRGTGFGTILIDFDGNGELDLAVANGAVKRDVRSDAAPPSEHGTGAFWDDYAQRNQLFANDGESRFRDISVQNPAFCGERRVSRGLCAGDVDNDGRVDLLVTTIAGPARLYRNVAPRVGHWLQVRAIDPALHRDAFGAEITVVAGQRLWYNCFNPAASYLCSNDPRVHFGLGAVEQVDEIRVIWPDGAEEIFPGGSVDRSIVLRKGDGTAGRTVSD